MMSSLSEKYPHLQFGFTWEHLLSIRNRELSTAIESELNVLKMLPLSPDAHADIYRLALKKGAHANVAIEGNSLSLEQVALIAEGKSLGMPSLKYSEQEVQNVFDVFNYYIRLCFENKFRLVSQDLLLEMHRFIGKDLGADFEAIPGRFREHNVVVGSYRAPENQDLPELLIQYEKWLQEQFAYQSDQQTFRQGLFQAVCAHIFFELLHPFGDGNGRVGRLLEFYLLLRAGVPVSCALLLANHYNNTRQRYYAKLNAVSKSTNKEQTIEAVIAFTEYALEGFLDGLRDNFKQINKCLWQIAWKQYVYVSFDLLRENFTKKDVFRRRRSLALLLPMQQDFTINRVRSLSEELSSLYEHESQKTLERDIKDLVEMNLLVFNNGFYQLNTGNLDAYVQAGRNTRHADQIITK